MQEFWATITAPQATVIAGACTFLAAVVGILLGWWLFSGRVRDLKSALDESDKLLKLHKTSVETALGGLKDSIGSLNDQVASTMQGLAQVRSDVSDIALIEEAPPAVAGAPSRAQLKEDWNSVRDSIESIAANPSIDGRTRARYGRVDRRNYADLVDMLAHDHRLNANADLFREAVALWQSYRTGKKALSQADAARMATLRALLAPQP